MRNHRFCRHTGCILSRCEKGCDGTTPFERLHGKKLSHEFVTFGEKVLDPRHTFGIWSGMRNNSAVCFIGNAVGVFRAREIRRLEPQSRWDREAVKHVVGVPWRMTDSRWTVDRPENRVNSIPIPPKPCEGARTQRERIIKQDIDEFGATVGSQIQLKGESPFRSLQSTT